MRVIIDFEYRDLDLRNKNLLSVSLYISRDRYPRQDEEFLHFNLFLSLAY